MIKEKWAAITLPIFLQNRDFFGPICVFFGTINIIKKNYMIGKWIRSLPFIFANKNYTLTTEHEALCIKYLSFYYLPLAKAESC